MKVNYRCMYGNYKPNFDIGGGKSILGSLRSFMIRKRVERQYKRENRSTGLKTASFWIFLTLGILLLFQCCKPHQVIVGEDRIVYVTKDSIVHRDSTVYVPVERYVNIVPVEDTLTLETQLAISHAWYDTGYNALRGSIQNKKAFEIRYVEVERVVTNDSIVERNHPIPYEVQVVKTKCPWWSWLTLGWTVICLVSFIREIIKKFKF